MQNPAPLPLWPLKRTRFLRRKSTEKVNCLSDHPWIKEDGEAPDTPLDNAVLNRLKQFRELNKFKQVALRVSH
ncbi:hypothetical protein HPP92_012455 [Vanilla planifolia]|uniref:Uncharacterized protein n=1 Tax=Vanilla planifolia TaxID=51239 RepID=A0A835V152_VANPL|nr:hypothetical protein HPP92_012455 [Vanilla planifolia]